MPRRAKSQSISSQTARLAEVMALQDDTMPPPSSALRARTSMTRSKTPIVDEIIPADSTPTLKTAVGPQNPSLAGYIGVVVISLLAEAATNFAASFVTPGDLAAISKHVDNPYETAALIAWKSTLLAIMWFAGFDGKHAP